MDNIEMNNNEINTEYSVQQTAETSAAEGVENATPAEEELYANYVSAEVLDEIDYMAFTEGETPVNFTSHEMSEEEIRQAAENIGTPLTSYNYQTENSTAYGAGAVQPEAAPAKRKRNPFLNVLKFIGIAAAFGLIAGSAFYGTSKALDIAFIDNSADAANVASITVSDAQKMEGTTGVQSLGTGNLVIKSTDTAEVGNTDNNVVVDVVKKNMSCTVAISCIYTTYYENFFGQRYPYESEGGGSGFIVGTNETELLVATNNHVCEDATQLQVVFSDGTSVNATVRSTDSENDLAIVSVLLKDIPEDTANTITIATLGDSETSEIGEMVIAIGNALGYGQSVTVGYLSAKDREVTISNVTQKLLQTDAAINEGNSGGPLFNVKGEVIGINCAKFADTSVEGMCFAIPISVAQPILKDLMKDVLPEEEQGYLGVSIKTITSDVASFYGWPEGVYVYSVVENGSAAKAGIYASDIITAINGKTTLTADKMKSVVNSYKIGETITVTLQRNVDGKWVEMNIDVTLMKKPDTTE